MCRHAHMYTHMLFSILILTLLFIWQSLDMLHTSQVHLNESVILLIVLLRACQLAIFIRICFHFSRTLLLNPIFFFF